MSNRLEEKRATEPQGQQSERQKIVASLAAMKDELRAEGVVQALLFGSAARGTHVSGQSDIDIAVRFDDQAKIDLLDVIRVKQMLADRLGARVDLVELPVRDRQLADAIEKDRIDAF